MDQTTITWAVGGVFTLCAITMTGVALRRGSVAEADKRYIAALEQMRKDDAEGRKSGAEVMKRLTESIDRASDLQRAMHKDNKEDHDRDMAVLRDGQGRIIEQHHQDLLEVRNALRGAEGAINAAVNSVERWRQP